MKAKDLDAQILSIAKQLQQSTFHIPWRGGSREVHLPIYDLLTKKPTLLQFLEFCLVGAIGVGINGLCYWVLGASGWIAWFLGILAATSSNFLLSKFWVFNKTPATTEEPSLNKNIELVKRCGWNEESVSKHYQYIREPSKEKKKHA